MNQLNLSVLLSLVLMVALYSSTTDEVKFTASDGVVIHGDLYEVPEGKSAPIILLFHQGLANARAEYRFLIPDLQERGYNVLAIDQRRGGDRLGGANRTVVGLGEAAYSYCDAYLDLEAALTYVKSEGFTGARIAWGSSYSAALAIQLGAKHSRDLAGVLAFSPASGEPMAGCQPQTYWKYLKMPLLILRPAREMEIESVQDQLQLAVEAGHQTYVAENGVHGSSMLNQDRVNAPVDPQWTIVMEFIDKVLE